MFVRTMIAPLLIVCALGSTPARVDAQAPRQADDEQTVAAPDDDAVRDTGEPPLVQAEAAYVDIDFARVAVFAQRALEEGGHDPSEVVRIYQLLGMANAALQNADEARSAFVRMLMLDPDEEVTELSPDLRTPYLEARGRVNALASRFTAEVALSRPQSSIIVTVSDPTHLASEVRISARVGGEGEFVEHTAPVAAQVRQRLEGLTDAGWAEYWLEVRDEHGNRLAAIGSADTPSRVGEPIVRIGAQEEEGRSVFLSPWFWVITVAVLAGAGVGAYFLFFQEPTWNGQTSLCFMNCE